MKPPAGFIVVGDQGVMTQLKDGCLHFCSRNVPKTLFPTKVQARRAIRATAKERREAGLEGEFAKHFGVRIVRLESAR